MPDTIAKGKELIAQGLPKDALELLQPWSLKPDVDPLKVGEAVPMVVDALQRLNRTQEADAYLESMAETHKDNWRVFQAVARIYHSSLPHFGRMIDNRFVRAPMNQPSDVDATGRDRVRALQLMREAEKLLSGEKNKKDVAQFYNVYAHMWWSPYRDSGQAWRLQLLTDLETLPDYEPREYRGHSTSRAPVDEDGNPVFYDLPETFEGARNDGMRWRWCLHRSVEAAPSFLAASLAIQAQFSDGQFGVQTLDRNLFWRQEDTADDHAQREAIWQLDTLKDTETITNLATGVKRLTLPDEYNPIALNFRIVKECPDAKKDALIRLAVIFANRNQFPRAAECWARVLAECPQAAGHEKEHYQAMLDQITGHWGRFEPTESALTGRGTDLRYRFRNGRKATFTARPIEVPKLLTDIKKQLAENKDDIPWQLMQIEQIGYQILNDTKNQAQYLGPETARWTVELEPAEGHRDRVVTVTTPMTGVGAYLVQAEMDGGNTESIVVWLNNTAIVKIPVEGSFRYFVADAETGKPLAGVPVRFFGVVDETEVVKTEDAQAAPAAGRRNARRPIRQQPKRFLYTTEDLIAVTDVDGMVDLPKELARTDVHGYPLYRNAQTLVTVDIPAQDGKPARFATYGFESLWFPRRGDFSDEALRDFFISDRPVYRPKDKVEMKFWLTQANYDMPDESPFAGEIVVFTLRNPKGEEVVKDRELRLDAYGGTVASFELPADAGLGQWYAEVRRSYTVVREISPGGPKTKEMRIHSAGGSFRVEEYRKPEYEVSIEAPTEPVALGEKIEAVIKANYYFGSPVTEATVKYTVLRSIRSVSWLPPRPWDWFYGNGYAWYAYDYDWYPGWTRWGTPSPRWTGRFGGPPELVVEREVPIGPDGTVKVEIDSAFAKAFFPNDDHEYTITAEVVDKSRRTITGTGSVIVAREPFKVHAWTDSGYYGLGKAVDVTVQTRRADGKSVPGKAVVKLLRITYEKTGERDDATVDTADDTVKVRETEVAAQETEIDEAGLGKVRFRADAPGQYRVSCTVTDAAGNAREGGYVFCVHGTDRADGGSFAFDDIELVPDKAEYAPGDDVVLRVNTRRVDATVLLFVRPENGIYDKAQVLRLEGKSGEVKIAVAQKDMPNFYVEALLVSGGRTRQTMREIAVPPQKRILNVEVLPSSETYKPGGKASVELRITDLDGKPVVGQTVASIYDKSVEAISGGSNVGDIKSAFWNWKRYHHGAMDDRLERHFDSMGLPQKPRMDNLGIFAGEVWETNAVYVNGAVPMSGGMRRSVALGMDFYDGDAVLAEAEAAPMAAPASSMRAKGGDALDVLVLPASGAEAGRVDGGNMVEPTVRKNFADTALWVGALETDDKGVAKVELDMPESLTTWKINVWTLAPGTRVGYGSTEVITRKDLMIRMQTPRFLVEKDRALFSAIVHNYLSTAKRVEVSLELEGDAITLAGMVVTQDGAPIEPSKVENTRPVTIPAGGEERVEWFVEARKAGEATVLMKALTDEESDAMQKPLTVYVHGMEKLLGQSGYVKSAETAGAVEIEVPEERRPEETKLTVRFSPTLAGAMIDALPYLADYPYGCTEQTLNRFLPTVLTQKALQRMNVDLAALEKTHTNLNPQELGDSGERAAQWNLQNARRVPKTVNPVYSVETVNAMVAEGVRRLTEMQCSDGGWGWFGGYGERSGGHLTALVVRGLKLAVDNDVAVEESVLQRGVDWLLAYQQREVERIKKGKLPVEERDKLDNRDWKATADDVDAFVYMVLAENGKGSEEMHEMKGYLWHDRSRLSLYAVSMFGIALAGENVEADKIMVDGCRKILEQYLVVDDENQTAYLDLRGMQGWCWWCWYGSEFETQAYYLRLLCRCDPQGETAPKLVKYLLNNRKHATYWNSTRDTAICVEAFAEFLKISGEERPNLEVEVLIDGKVLKTATITPENLFAFDNTFVLEGEAVGTGKHRVELRKKGDGPLYFNVYLQYFSLEDPIAKAGSEVKVERRFYRLDRDSEAETQTAGSRGQVVRYGVEKFKRTPLVSLAEVKSGDLVEVELIVESKNDYESLVIEDKKAAGLEPVDQQSGYTGNSLGAYVEYRDERVAMFVYRLARGTHSVGYRLRAEQPGAYSALPTVIEGMYAPELKGNSDEFKVRVEP